MPKSPAARSRAGQTSPGLIRGLALLEHLARTPAGLTLSDLAGQLDLPVASVLRLGRSLEKLGYVDRDPATRRFTLTNKFLRLGQPTAGERALSECALEPMRAIRRATGETVQLCCRIDTDMVILEQLLATQPFKYSADIGARCPVYSCAPGKALVAFLPDEERAELVGRLRFRRFTPTTITSRAAFLGELAEIRRAGYAVDRAEGLQGIHCVAAPILDRHGHATAALTIAGPADRIPADEFATIGRIVVAEAHRAAAAFHRHS